MSNAQGVQNDAREIDRSSKPRIAIIIGSTRAARIADKPAQWILKQAKARGDFEVELVDLRDHPMPFFNEAGSDKEVPSQSPEARRWQQTVAAFDGFIFVVCEYNHSITGVLKNALDQAYTEWNRKAFTAIGYGAVGAARAIEHLRLIGLELQMVSTFQTVHISGGDFVAISEQGGYKPVEDFETHLLPSTKLALDELLWWTCATMKARNSVDR